MPDDVNETLLTIAIRGLSDSDGKSPLPRILICEATDTIRILTCALQEGFLITGGEDAMVLVWNLLDLLHAAHTRDDPEFSDEEEEEASASLTHIQRHPIPDPLRHTTEEIANARSAPV